MQNEKQARRSAIMAHIFCIYPVESQRVNHPPYQNEHVGEPSANPHPGEDQRTKRGE